MDFQEVRIRYNDFVDHPGMWITRKGKTRKYKCNTHRINEFLKLLGRYSGGSITGQSNGDCEMLFSIPLKR